MVLFAIRSFSVLDIKLLNCSFLVTDSKVGNGQTMAAAQIEVKTQVLILLRLSCQQQSSQV